jgi:hypothetical protein
MLELVCRTIQETHADTPLPSPAVFVLVVVRAENDGVARKLRADT